MRRFLSATAILGTALLAGPVFGAPQDAAASKPAAASLNVSWTDISAAISDRLALARQGQNRWTLAISDVDPAQAGPQDAVKKTAVEALQAAFEDLAWMVSEVTYKRYSLPGITFKVGQKVDLRDAYARAFFKNPSFSDPLRRQADAAARTHGLVCSDCLAGLRPDRDVLWVQVRKYIEDLIFIKAVGMDGRVDLRVGGYENALPEFAYCDQDIAGAVFAFMQTLTSKEPEFQTLVQLKLNEELLKITEIKPREAEARLNKVVPDRILDDPEAIGMVEKWLPEALARHGLTCKDCPHGGAQSGTTPKSSK